MEVFVFCAFLIAFIYFGLASSRKGKSDNAKEYLLAGGDVSPLLTALSAAATKYSGYMFIALMGYIYTYGVSAIWLIFGFLFGDLIAFFFVHKEVRRQTEKTGAVSFSELLAKWHGGNYSLLRSVIGFISLMFLITYAAAQFSAGGKALHVLFGWNSHVGVIVGAALILSYCLYGGLRASIWTDALQSIIMMAALVILLAAAVFEIGGPTNFFASLQAVSPSFLDFGVDRFGSLAATAMFATGWLFNGLGVIGQPHIMVRFMALDEPKNMRMTGIYYFSWSTLFLGIVLMVGLATRVFVGEVSGFDAELALPSLAKLLLPSFAVGIVMGGIFAAVMSTTDSQILSCSAILSEDFKMGHSNKAKSLITLSVTIIALFISLFANKSVFTLVILAWSGLSSSFGPLVIVYALGKRPSQTLAMVMMIVGLVTAMLWHHNGLHTHIYEGMPGMLSGLLVFVIGYFLFEKKTETGLPSSH
ncbi:MAG: sodium/proline symporter [Gammaproteobacteria bacterium]|nr:sodium/proline symporter [Gammaproteobacteria bacterium]